MGFLPGAARSVGAHGCVTTYIHHRGIAVCFHRAPPAHPPRPATHPQTLSLSPPPQRHLFQSVVWLESQRVAFSDGRPSLGHLRLRSLRVFSWLGSSFLFGSKERSVVRMDRSVYPCACWRTPWSLSRFVGFEWSCCKHARAGFCVDVSKALGGRRGAWRPRRAGECPERRTPPGTLRPRRRRAAAPGVRRLTGVGCCLFISVGVSLTTRTVGCVSMSGFAVLVSSPGRRLFRSSARFFIRSFALSLLSFKSSLYILEKSPVSDVSLANILS